jgi:hypothetical protein
MKAWQRNTGALTVAGAVMSAHKHGRLYSGSGQRVVTRRQAVAIALAMQDRAAGPGPDVQAGASPAAPDVDAALRAVAEVNPSLAPKVQRAAREQLLLLPAGPAPQVDHDWRYRGQEQAGERAVIDECAHCGLVRRTARRGGGRRDTYATGGSASYARTRPACRPQRTP